MTRFVAPAALLAGLCLTAPAADPPPGFTALFNGRDFTGWHGWAIHAKGGNPLEVAKLSPEEKQKRIAEWTEDLKKHWTIEDGEFVNRGRGAYLTTDKEYGDCEFLVEYKIEPTVDSGIYMKTMPQIQVWDPTEPGLAQKDTLGKLKGSGGLWNNPAGWPGKDPLARADNPPGQWNKFRIIQLGDRTTIYLNDKLVVDHARLANFWEKDKKTPLPKKAAILLQTHGPEKEIRWRNIAVREIAPEEANKMLADKLGDGFTPIFNGKDLDGWQGATANYEVVDGAIRCKKGKGGALFTKQEYGDFQVALEIKLPKNGNNGLGIRYPGTGDGAYTGMCELQVLDDDYKGIDPRQAHGSAYGMVAAARGHQRPVGEWNFQLVTVKGPTIQVELNGAQILDCDLSKVTEYLGKTPHTGKDRATGFFAFLGHGDAVEFRNVRVKPLQ